MGMFSHLFSCVCVFLLCERPSWLWLYGRWLYNYLCNQCLSPLKFWVRTPFMARCTRYNIMWYSLWVTCGRSVVFSGYSGFLHQTNKTEILLKVVLSTINQTYHLSLRSSVLWCPLQFHHKNDVRFFFTSSYL